MRSPCPRVDSARRRAEDELLDPHLFVLNEKDYDAFLSVLDQPTKPTAELRKLLTSKAPWES
jgi:uncharacterized protein (DUF1778 family)